MQDAMLSRVSVIFAMKDLYYSCLHFTHKNYISTKM